MVRSRVAARVAGRLRSAWKWWPTYAGILFVIIGAAALYFVPGWLVEARGSGNLTDIQRQTVLASATQTVLFCLGGAIAVAGVALSLYRHRRDETAAGLELDANWTARYTEAIRQLGDASATIRIGAIFALERIAEDSVRDRQTVLDVLLLFLKESSPRTPGMDDEEWEFDEASDVAAASLAAARVSRLSPPRRRLSLTGTNLAGASLNGAVFKRARLDSSIFLHADLSAADLSGAVLHDARFDDARMTGADLSRTMGPHATFRFALLRNADFERARLNNASFAYASAERCNFSNSYLRGSDMSAGRFVHADFKDAALQSTTWAKANLRGANLAGADFSKSDLSLAVGLTVEQVQSAYWDELTRWPDSVKPPEDVRRPPRPRRSVVAYEVSESEGAGSGR